MGDTTTTTTTPEDIGVDHFTREDLAVLTNAIKYGEKKVRLNNREIEYHSL